MVAAVFVDPRRNSYESLYNSFLRNTWLRVERFLNTSCFTYTTAINIYPSLRYRSLQRIPLTVTGFSIHLLPEELLLTYICVTQATLHIAKKLPPGSCGI